MLTRIKLCLLAFCLVSCINDDIDTGNGAGLEFSCDRLDLGIAFTEVVSPKSVFKVYNRHDKGVLISSVAFRDDASVRGFCLNVDGEAGTRFENILIRGGDSIYVFVEAQLPATGTPEPVLVGAPLDFTVNGNVYSVNVNAMAQDAVVIDGCGLDADTELASDYPYRVEGNVVVPEGVTLSVARGVRLYFNAGASLEVMGRLFVDGTPDAPVLMAGNRFGNVVSDIPFDEVPGQWGGISVKGAGSECHISHASVVNTKRGIAVSDAAVVELVNCRIHNSTSSVLSAVNADVSAVGCELSCAPGGVLLLDGGRHVFNHCTIANDYIFSPVEGALIEIGDAATELSVTNSIVYGAGSLLAPVDIAGRKVSFKRCILKGNGSDGVSFSDILWNVKPGFRTAVDNYLFDYRLDDGSPAIGAADLSLPASAVDYYGLPRGAVPDIGAYVYRPFSQSD